jgi:arginyl-tRNA synthetase
MKLLKNEIIKVLENVGIKNPLIEKPPQEANADLAFPCFSLAKSMNKNPVDIAYELAVKMVQSKHIKDIDVAGPYINFHADWSKLGQLVLKDIAKNKDKYGSGTKKKKNVLIEHTSADPHGPLNIEHFRNSVLGDSIARLISFSGSNVSTIFFVNDTGRQIAIATTEYLKRPLEKGRKPDWWVLDLYLNGNRVLEKDEKFKACVEDNIRKFEAGDSGLRKNFELITGECLKGFRQTLAGLGITIGEFYTESTLLNTGAVKALLEDARKLPETRMDKGRLWIDLTKFGIDREFTITREDGTTLYPARDMAFHRYKFSKADANVNVIGTDQKFYFKQLNSALSLLHPKEAENYSMVFYEFLTLPEGSMSTRAGRFVSVDDVMEKALKLAEKVVNEKMPHYAPSVKKDIAKAVGVGALKYVMIKASPEKTYAFSVEEALSFEGNNAPYIQYTHARARSILSKAAISAFPDFHAKFLTWPHEVALLRKLSEFPEAAELAARDMRPHYIATYAYELATIFNEFYQAVPVLKAAEPGGAAIIQKNLPLNHISRSPLAKTRKKMNIGPDPMVKQSRLALVMAVALVLKRSLELLGIEAPDKM